MCIYYIIYIIIFVYFILYFRNYQLSIKNINYENFDNNNIPKIIIQTWKTYDIPIKYKNDISSIKKYNSDYQYLFFSDNDIDIFLQKYYPDNYNIYKKLPVIIQRIDYFRYIASYCHYYDNKETNFKNLAAVVLPFIG